MECTRFKSFQKGSLLGFADIYVDDWGVDIPGFKLYQKDGRRWVQVPSTEYEKDGETKYNPLFKFREKERWEAFVNEAKLSIDRFCKAECAKEAIKDLSDQFSSNHPF